VEADVTRITLGMYPDKPENEVDREAGHGIEMSGPQAAARTNGVPLPIGELPIDNDRGMSALPAPPTHITSLEPWRDPKVTIGLIGGIQDAHDPILSKRVGIGTTDKSWTKNFTLHKVPGDGDCFFSSVNYLIIKLIRAGDTITSLSEQLHYSNMRRLSFSSISQPIRTWSLSQYNSGVM